MMDKNWNGIIENTIKVIVVLNDRVQIYVSGYIIRVRT